MNIPRFFSPTEKADDARENNFIQCALCPWRCVLAAGETGRCRVRRNFNGKPELPYYGFVTSASADPIEKKPLYHYRPGTYILSAGFAGCNLRCPFCQNWHISQSTDVPGRFCSPAELSASVQKLPAKSPKQIAYTYSEPLVHFEFISDCMKEMRKAGIANVLVSNGCVNAEAAEEILEHCDAANIDLKCFSEETYEKVLGGKLKTVLNFIRAAAEKKVHLEITTLVVPGFNDSKAELDKCRDFIAELETNGIIVPWHLSAYHPDWKWNAPATESLFIVEAAKRAREKLSYVYTGNIALDDSNFNDTLCPYCGNVLIKRGGLKVDTSGLSINRDNGNCFCARCGKPAPVRW